MKCTIFTLAALVAVAYGGVPSGPKFTINVRDPELKEGVGSLGLTGEWEREIADHVSAGLTYDYDRNRGLPSKAWLSTTAEIDDDTTLSAKAEYDMKERSTVIEARLQRGGDELIGSFDTNTNEFGPVKIRKVVDFNGRRLTLKPKIDLKERTGEMVVNAEIDEDKTTAELTVDALDDLASLEVSHRIDDYNIISPKVDLKSGDMSLRLNRALESGGILEVVASKRNVDFEITEEGWTVKGNIPLEDTGASKLSFKRTIKL